MFPEHTVPRGLGECPTTDIFPLERLLVAILRGHPRPSFKDTFAPIPAQRRRTQGWSSGLAEPEKSMRPSPGPNIKVGLKLSLEMCSGEAPHSDPDAVMCVGIKHTPVPHLCSGSQRREPPPTPYHQCIGAAPAPGPSSHLPLHCHGVSEGVSKSVSSTWVTLVPGTLKVLNNSSKCSVKYLLNQTTHS